MKYAVKPQSQNPSMLPGTNPNAVWLSLTISDDQASSFISDGWVVSDQDDYMQKFLNKIIVVVPDSVTPRQARQALLLSGITEDMIISAISSLPSPTKEMAKIEWEYSVAFLRHNPLVTTMAGMLGWNSQQLDQLWIMASKL